MARRTRQESLETRERLLDAALELFHLQGVSRTTLADIAARAGVTRGAIYVHFQNKADLFKALLDRTLLPIQEQAARCPGSGSPLQRLRTRWVMLLRRTATDPAWRCMFDVAFHKCEKLEENGDIVQNLRDGRLRAIAELKATARQAIAAGELPEDLDVDLAIPVVHGCVLGTISQWLLHGHFDLEARAEDFVDGMIAMLRTAPSLRRAPGAPQVGAAG